MAEASGKAVKALLHFVHLLPDYSDCEPSESDSDSDSDRGCAYGESGCCVCLYGLAFVADWECGSHVDLCHSLLDLYDDFCWNELTFFVYKYIFS